MAGEPGAETRLVAGGLLLVGTAVFFTGAALYVAVLGGTDTPLPEALTRMAASPVAWVWANGLLAAGVVLTLLGLAVLTQQARAVGDPAYARVGLTMFSLGTVFWIVVMAYRVAVLLPLAEMGGGTVPPFYDPILAWMDALSRTYRALAHASLAVFGISILRTHIVPRELGWFGLGYSAVVLILLVASGSSPPFLVHVFPLFLGLALLAQAWPEFRWEPRKHA